VRLRHRPSGLATTARESRSQQDNRAHALTRLREAIALTYRLPPPETISWPETVYISDRQLHVNPKNPAYYQVLALVLDVLVDQGLQPREAALYLGLTPSSLLKFLAANPTAWAAFSRLRREAGLPALKVG